MGDEVCPMPLVSYSRRVSNAVRVEYDHGRRRYKVAVHWAPPGLSIVLPNAGRGVFSWHGSEAEANDIAERLRAVMGDVVAEAVREEMRERGL